MGYLNSSDIRTVLVAADPARESRNVMNPMRLTRVRVEGLVRSKSARRERRCRRRSRSTYRARAHHKSRRSAQ
ncbi:hypothetical protein NEOLEDRAFT_818058 [Neolentinus lepideus HHB14362 ss-1]|uniref:Uncharacterized protein n=1 Tax=Neolentinus lepideus HHB14362 ss-1 TaxID=1314782 RepID=A0A165PDH5_9AGAM|nr:hypothetical protein NEOLEDRAFT_818058 [Neolentinus lepideus HHB14362 ss-1]